MSTSENQLNTATPVSDKKLIENTIEFLEGKNEEQRSRVLSVDASKFIANALRDLLRFQHNEKQKKKFLTP